MHHCRLPKNGQFFYFRCELYDFISLSPSNWDTFSCFSSGLEKNKNLLDIHRKFGSVCAPHQLHWSTAKAFEFQRWNPLETPASVPWLRSSLYSRATLDPCKPLFCLATAYYPPRTFQSTSSRTISSCWMSVMMILLRFESLILRFIGWNMLIWKRTLGCRGPLWR